MTGWYMKHCPARKMLLAAVIAALVMDGGSLRADTITLDSLTSRQVVQRDANNSASLNIAGTLSGAATQVEARAVDFLTGNPVTNWTLVDDSVSGGSYAGSLNVGAGWYRIEVRGTDSADHELISSGVDRVGIGDVYVTAGQSNSANYGDPQQTPDSDLVEARTSITDNTWQFAVDPQPIADGTDGSPWPQLGDLLVGDHGVPIGFVSLGIGSSSVIGWQPGHPYYDDRLKLAIQSLVAEGGFKAILWHQGETDAINGTPTDVYAADLEGIIAQARIDAGFDVPWGVALASYHPDATQENQDAIQAAQQMVIDSDPLVFQGAYTNDFHLLGYLSGKVHFNQQGLDEHAARWDAAINAYFFPTVVPTPGALPAGLGLLTLLAIRRRR